MKPILEEARELARPEAQREAFVREVGQSMGQEAAQRVLALETLVARMAADLGENIQISKLKRMLFGPKTETSQNVLPESGEKKKRKDKRPGHGRTGQTEYRGARTQCVKHPQFKPGQICPKCGKGKLVEQKPSNQIHIKAHPPIEATRYQLERLRCAVCGEVFTAPLPIGVPNVKYDDTVGVMLGVMRFGYGLPNYRLARMQEMQGVPMAESTQWELMAQTQSVLGLAYEALKVVAAQAHLFHIDDTRMRVQELKRKAVDQAVAKGKSPRKGIFTSVILAMTAEWQVSLYFTGNRYAAERMEEIMKHRAAGLSEPVQMSDALTWNGARDYPFIEALCLTHGRREFVDLVKAFPEAARRVIMDLREVYATDAQAKELSPEARLVLHQQRSGPIMEGLKEWMESELAEKRVEPNSGLGGAMKYMLKHWQGMTLFLRQAGAPLDNSAAERAIKRAVLHRKNSLSYLTVKGAELGDVFMSLIETCRMNEVNPLEYLMALVKNPKAVAEHPEQWLPWNYPRPPVEAAA